MSIVTGGWGTGGITTSGWGASVEGVLPLPLELTPECVERMRLSIVESLINQLQTEIIKPDLVTKQQLSTVVTTYEMPIIELRDTISELEQRVLNLRRAIAQRNQS